MNTGEWFTLAGLIIAVVGISGGVIIWAVRLEGRCNVLDEKHTSLQARQARDEESLKETRTSIEAQIAGGFREMRDNLERIFDKLDTKADKPR